MSAGSGANAKKAARPSPPAATGIPVSAEPLSDGTLTLQALVWSEIAEKRMVVVNNRIRHIGESVDGYDITRIGTDHIIVRRDGKDWKVDFTLK